MANVFFKKGLLANLPSSYAAGTFYVTTDERAMYLDIDDSTRIRLGDFIQVDAVANLPTDGASTSALYYCVAENILAKWNGSTWTQINKQPTADEMKTLLGLGTMAYKSEVAEDDLNADLKAKVNAAAEGNHSHDNKELLDTYTQTEADLADAVAKKHEHANADELAKIADGDVAKWNNKVDKEEGKSLVSDTEIARLATLANYDDTQVNADIAKKVDKVEGYSLVSDTEIARLADVDNYDDTALAGRVTTAEGKITALETESAKHATKDELNDVDAKFADYTKTADLPTDLGDFTNNAGYAKTADVNTELDKKADKTQVATDIANAIAPLATTEALNGVKATAEAAAVATEVEAALALKADKSVVDAMYTNAKIDELVQGAKDYADANDADTKYGIVYDSENKKIKLVEGGSEVEIDATDFIKDGMIETVTIGDDNDLVITFNTAAGKENIVLPLDQLVDIYTGVEGARVKVTVASDKSISADLVAGSISKNYLDSDVQASLAKADSALQEHQDISHLATTEALNGVDAKFANYTNTTDMNAALDLKADKTQVATDIATAKQAAIDDAATKYVTTATHNTLSERVTTVESVADDAYAKTQANETKIGEVETAFAEYKETNDAAVAGKLDANGWNSTNGILNQSTTMETYGTFKTQIHSSGTTVSLQGENGTSYVAISAMDQNSATIGHSNHGLTVITYDSGNNLESATVYSDGAIRYTTTDGQAAILTIPEKTGTIATTDDVDTKANAADVYAKTETYTQAEVDALLSAATSWGEF